MVQGYTQQTGRSEGGWPSLPRLKKSKRGKASTRSIIDGSKDFFRSYTRGVAHEQWSSSHPEECKQSGAEGSDREVGGLVTGIIVSITYVTLPICVASTVVCCPSSVSSFVVSRMTVTYSS